MRRLAAILVLVLAWAVEISAQQPVTLSQYPPGRVAAASSLSMTLSTEDKAVLDSLDTKLTTLSGYVDGVEGLLTTGNAHFTTLEGYVDGLETLIGTTNTNTGTIATNSGTIVTNTGTIATNTSTLGGYLDGVEGLLTTSNAHFTTLEGYVDGLEALIGTTNTNTGTSATNSGTIAANTGNSATSLSVIDDWDETDRAKVNVIVGQAGVAAGAGVISAATLRVTLASDDLSIGYLSSISSQIGDMISRMGADVAHGDVAPATMVGPLNMGFASATAPANATVATGDTVAAWYLLNGAQATVLTAAGALIGGDAANGLDVDVTRVTGTVTVAPTATTDTTQSALECSIISAASTNSNLCKNAAGNFYGVDLVNTTTTTYYLRLYNLSAAPTCSSATGFVRSIPIPPAGAAGGAGGIVRVLGIGVGYSTGISYCLTGGASSTDNTNAAVGILGSILYK